MHSRAVATLMHVAARSIPPLAVGPRRVKLRKPFVPLDSKIGQGMSFHLPGELFESLNPLNQPINHRLR